MEDLPKPRVFPDLLVEHFEELDFLWEQRESVVFSPDWTRADLAVLEERAEAQLDGLRLGGAHSVDIALPSLTGKEPSAATAATFVLLSTGDPGLQADAARALEPTNPRARDGVRIGLRHSDISRIVTLVAKLTETRDLTSRALACDVLAFHRVPRPSNFAELISATDPDIQILAFGAAGRFGGPWNIGVLEQALRGANRPLQRAAFETSARLAVPGLADLLRRAAMAPRAASPEALACLGVLGDRADLPLLLKALDRSRTANGALAGLGALGDPAAVPVLIEWMGDEDTTLAAGRAFVRITGATGIEADEQLPPPEELPEDEREFWDGPRPPDPERAHVWWAKNGSRFKAASRWQAGVDVSDVLERPDLLDTLPLDCRRDMFLSVRARNLKYEPNLELEAHTPAFAPSPVAERAPIARR